MPLAEVQVLFQLVQHGSSASMDAKVLKRKLEIGNVRFGRRVLLVHLRAEAAELPAQ